MNKKRIPQSLNVIVYSAKGLKPKKTEHCKFLVVFGVGNKKFKSELVEDFYGSPSFNTEADIPLVSTDTELKFKVTEKTDNDLLGKLVVPLLDLPFSEKDANFTVGLRGKGEDNGELIFKAWVSSYKELKDDDSHSFDSSMQRSTISLGLSKLKDRILRRNDSNPNLFNRRKTSPKVGDFGATSSSSSSSSHHPHSLKASSSCHDFNNFNLSPFLDGDDHDTRFDDEEDLKPEVSGVSPKEGSVDGGTRLVIRGKNFGGRKEELVGLFVCGSNCLSSLEYFSPSKIACVTKPWKAGEGNISIETQTGGRGVCLVKFTFIQPSVETVERRDSVKSVGITFNIGDSRRSSDGWRSNDGKWGSDGGRGNDARRSSGSSLASLKHQDSLPTPSLHGATPPSESSEAPVVTGISPNEGHFNERTRVVLRGSNLGVDEEDLLKIMICGKDYRHTLESCCPTKVVCHVGPVLKATRGEIMVETVTGGVGFSLVEFKLVDRKKEVDAHISRLLKSQSSPKRNSAEQDQLQKQLKQLQHLQQLQDEPKENFNHKPPKVDSDKEKIDYNKEKDYFDKEKDEFDKEKVDFDKEKVDFDNDKDKRRSLSEKVKANVHNHSPATSPQTSASKDHTKSPFAVKIHGKTTGTSGHVTGTTTGSVTGSTTGRHVENGSSNIKTVKPAYGGKPPVVEIVPMVNQRRREEEREELINTLESRLKLRDKEIEELVTANRELRDECGRLRSYMDALVAKAINHCPSILAVER